MEIQRAPVYVQPQARRPFMHGTSVGGRHISGNIILAVIIGSSIVLFIGLCMAAFGYDYKYYYATGSYYYRRSGVRKAGIVFTFFGGLTLIFGVLFAFKAHGENKITRGVVIQPRQMPDPNQPTQQAYPSGFGYSQEVHAFPQPMQQPQVQVQNEIPPPYHTSVHEGVKY